MNVLSQTLSGSLADDEGLRSRLHAVARSILNATWFRRFGPPPAPMSATRPEQDSKAQRRGTCPGESPAPSIAFPTAAGWVPVLPPELRMPPPSRLTASGACRARDEQRQPGSDRRFRERRIRNDGSPYGLERRSGGEDRAAERRAAPATRTPEATETGTERRLPQRLAADYAPHLPDLLARFHGR